MRALLVDSYFDDVLDDEEMLYDASFSKNIEFPYEDYGQFQFEEISDPECLAEFRFHKRDIPVLAKVLGIPDAFICNQGTVCDRTEALCLLLRRFSYPCRYSDLIPRFGKPVSVLSMVCNTVMDFIYDLHCHKITGWNNNILDPASLQIYADAVHNKGAALGKLMGL